MKRWKDFFPPGLLALMLAALVARLACMILVADLDTQYYLEFGAIAKNIRAGRGFSLFYYEGGALSHVFATRANPHPSAYMPPGYVAYLVPFLAIGNAVWRNVLLLSVQHAAGALCVFLMFHLVRERCTRRTAYVAAGLYALFPAFIYASNTYSATVFFHLGLLALFSLLRDRKEARAFSVRRACALGGLLAMLTYFRSECLLLAVLVLGFFAMRRSVRRALVAAAVAVSLLAPWLARNYVTFGQPVYNTSAGLNLYRGNNPNEIGNWGSPALNRALQAHGDEADFEVEMNRAYRHRAIRFIKKHPGRALRYAAEKLFRLWVLNVHDDRSDHFLYYVPQLLLLLAVATGLGLSYHKRGDPYVYLFLLHASLNAAVFFALPRHQILMNVALLPIAAYGLTATVRRFSTR